MGLGARMRIAPAGPGRESTKRSLSVRIEEIFRRDAWP